MASRCPTVSVIIPARDAAPLVREAVLSALDQDYAGELEVVVAVPPEDHATRAALRELEVRVVDNPDGSTPHGLNRALEAARGEVIVRCDAQSRLPPGYVSRAVHLLETTGAANVGGIQRGVGETFFERAVAIAQSTPLGVGDARYRLGGPPGWVDTVYLGVFRRSALEEVGGFDPDLKRNQDYELNYRLRAAGYGVWFDPSLVVDYRPRGSLRELWRQYWDYGSWKRRVLRLHPGSLRWRQLAAPCLVIALAASGVGISAGAVWMGLLPAGYGTALALTGLVEAVRRHDLAGLLSPVALGAMHLAWGLGFLFGQSR
jgi:cellulose synthase/poly-beta-1,6-N-acetylglucosamine synthase-like glycosyltransferase